MTKRYNYRLCLIALLYIFPLALFAQTQIQGQITDADNQPIFAASVLLEGSTIGTTTDKDGNFQLEDIPTGKATLVVRAIGYLPIKQPIHLTQNNTQLPIILQKDNRNLDEVVVSGTLREVSKLESPIPVEVYSAKFFRANPTPTIFESLQNINGVRPQINCSVCNTGDIHINGLEGPYTMVLIDGMPIVSGLSTVYGLNGIPQALIERVEIVKGPAS